MATLEEKGILGIKGIIFDLYNTLIDIHTDEESINTYEAVSKWLIYQGVKIPAEDLKNDYRRMAKEGMEAKWEKHPEIRVEDIFGRICKSHAFRDIDEVRLGVETARVFGPCHCAGCSSFLKACTSCGSWKATPKSLSPTVRGLSRSRR